MSTARLDALRDDLAAKKTRAFLVVRNDKIVYEWYADGQSATTKQGTASLAKAIVGGLSFAVAANDGLIALDDPAWKHVPAWKNDPVRSKITVRHLGSHTSGIDDSHNREERARGVNQGNYTGWSGEFWRWRNGKQRPPDDAFSISRDVAPVLFDPGTGFQYSNPGIAMLSYCVTASLKGTKHSDVRTLLRERIMRPIGAKDDEWSCGYGMTEVVEGLPMVANWGGGSYTPRAAARIGRLVLRRGDWDGERLLSEKSVADMSTDGGLPGHCGMGWWTNGDGRYEGMPRDAVWGAGAGHQILLVVPSLNLIAVRNGAELPLEDVADQDKRYHEAVYVRLFKPLLEAVTDKAKGNSGAGGAEAASVDFERDVWSIFQARCIECHGPQQQKSSLRVDSRGELLAGGDSGPAIVAGDPGASYLLELVSSDDPDVRMPPKGKPLTKEQIAHLRQWIAAGAEWPESAASPLLVHWSFKPISRPPVPSAAKPEAGAIDAFLVDRLQADGLTMSSPADARTFIRRVTLDLTGLPPTPDEAKAFVAECSAMDRNHCGLPQAAVERLVDRLLDSPRYGERWGQHWLDVIRYADTTGYEKNRVRPSAWPYRDYVIAALNADISWPRFILEQLAGDSVDMDPATGFLVTPPFPEPIEVGQEPELIAQVRFNGLDEVVQNVSSSLLGLTIGCARCHDHKFDPVSASDYYRLAATFAGLEFADRPWTSGALPVERTEPIERRLAEIRRQLRAYPASREVEPTRTTEVFEPVKARRIRMLITAGSDKEHAPAIDELEVWSRAEHGLPSRNVGSSAQGAVARSSGADEKLKARNEFLNDGRYGEQSLWIASHRTEAAEVWVEVELPRTRVIDRVSWSRDPTHLSPDFIRLSKRTPARYAIQVAEQPGEWRTVAGEPRTVPLSESDLAGRSQFEDEFAGHTRRLRDLTQVFAGSFRTPDAMHVLRRGDPQQKREPIGPGGIAVLGSYELPPETPDAARRIALAEWLGRDDHPLMARVVVNRVWQHHFGTGIVDTPSDFGTRGGRPTHPELLDWLASEFMARGARLKPLHRLICTSAAYRQSSRPNPKALAIDADSRLLWRFPPRRLEAEAIRDSMIFVSGALDPAAGGPGVNIYESKRYGSEYRPREDLGEGPWRRSIYLLRVRGADDGLFKAFDVPDCGQVRPKRTSSTTPLQALNLLNSSFTQTLSHLLAQRIRQQAGDDSSKQIEHLYALALARPPSASELGSCRAVAVEQRLETVCRAVFNCNEFLFIE